MNKIMFLILIYLFCISGSSCDSAAGTTVKEKNIEIFCDNFIKTHSNWSQNEIINKKTNNDLSDSLTKYLPGILVGFPLRLYRINEYSPREYAAHLCTDNTMEYLKGKYNFTFDVIALIPKKDVDQLKTDSMYEVLGDFKKFLHDDYRNYSNGLANTPLIQIQKSYDNPEFDFGIILMDSVTLKRIDW